MDQETRNKLQRATQQVRRILEEEFAEQLEGTFDVLADGTIQPEPGKHLDTRQRLTRQKLVDAIEHIKASGKTPQEAVDEYTREAAFTFLNRFVALRMLEARGLIQECVSKGGQSGGFNEFCGLAPGLASLEDGGYRLYLECLFDELSVEVKVLFDRRDPASLLWPRRGALTELLGILGQADLVSIWSEDETIGWVYQYFNSREERKKMRDESQAPRNSRELAVRNQFFTPRYVVEFLTDNTLGRIWYEMRSGNTRLVNECRYLVRRPSEAFLNEGEEPPEDEANAEQDLSQEELLKKTVYIPHRPKKDPRDLKILDPACGSGHFLLYAFDLLVTIYEESWHDKASAKSEITGKRLQEDYPDLEQLHAAIPGLVLRHNLHGIDIDPRAAQIAALALWMRGQRAYNDASVSRECRPLIAKSNIVCAEPMPGEERFLVEFIEQELSESPEKRLLSQLVQRVFTAMQLAGEAGALLKIEEEISDALREAKTQWASQPKQTQQTLFELEEDKSIQLQLDLDVSGITDATFWGKAEQRIYAALNQYSDSAEISGFQRRLFSNDTARGFSFIDVCRNEYDVALMNPPFGLGAESTQDYFKERYPFGWENLLCCFVQRCLALTHETGIVGAILDDTWAKKKDYAAFRREVVLSRHLFAYVHLGWGVLDANVETSASVLSKYKAASLDSAIFVVGEDDNREHALVSAVQNSTSGKRLPISQSAFLDTPNQAIAHSISDSILNILVHGKKLPDSLGEAKIGMKPADNFRFIRANWEVPREKINPNGPWKLCQNGSPYSPFYYPSFFVAQYSPTFRHLRPISSSRTSNSEYYGRAGLSYGKRTDYMYAYVMEKDHLFTNEGQAVFYNRESDKWTLLAILNSAYAQEFINHFCGQHKESGYVNELRVPPMIPIEVSVKAQEICETLSWIASMSGMRDATGQVLGQSFEDIAVSIDKAHAKVASTHRQIDELIATAIPFSRCFHGGKRNLDYYGIFLGTGQETTITRVVKTAFAEAVNLCFEEPRPNDGQAKDLLVDDPGHDEDLSKLVRDAFAAVEGDGSTTLRHALKLLSGDSDGSVDLRTWLAKYFFDEDIARHSKSTRKAPIYWQLATPSASYSVWLYHQRLTRDTFFKVLNEYVTPKLDHERQKLERRRGEAGAEPTRSQRKEIEEQEKFVAELASMAEEVERIAPLWNPDLNDGVIINFAPLWRLVPQNRSWQKECKSCWDKLVKGDYDWAHLAMHLWPERVVPKCVTDASLAIAHGLEDVFWQQDDRDRFHPKEEPDGGWQPVSDRLVAERTSAAVKAALDSLLTAPAPAGSARGNRRRKAKAR